MEGIELDIEELPPKLLRKMLRAAMAKRSQPRSDEETDKADEERDELARLHDEKKTGGSSDLPEELSGEDEEGDEDSPKKRKKAPKSEGKKDE